MLNLTLIPIMEGQAFFEEASVIYPTERISFSEAGDSQKLLENIEALKPKPIPRGKKVVLYERGSEAIDKSPYGERITYIYPKTFSRFKLPSGFHKWETVLFQVHSHAPEIKRSPPIKFVTLVE